MPTLPRHIEDGSGKITRFNRNARNAKGELPAPTLTKVIRTYLHPPDNTARIP